MNMRSRRAGTDAGMTLVEVLLALGLTAGVLISVASMFVLGGQRVKGSRNMTEAMAHASDVLEELYDIGANTLPETFPDCCGGGSCDAVTGCTVSSDSDTYLQSEWLPGIRSDLHLGRLEITLLPVGGSVEPPTFSSSEGIRMHVHIYWNEGPSVRSASQETVLF